MNWMSCWRAVSCTVGGACDPPTLSWGHEVWNVSERKVNPQTSHVAGENLKASGRVGTSKVNTGPPFGTVCTRCNRDVLHKDF